MKEDYLWDRSGEPDPEIQKLENTLRPLRYRGERPDFPVIPSGQPGSRRHPLRIPRFSYVPLLSIAAIAFVLIMATWWFMRGTTYRTTYQVSRLRGTPKIGASPIGEAGHIRVGQWLETDSSSRASIRLGEIGEVEVAPNTLIGVVQARKSEHRLSLQRGTIHAFVLAPPRTFVVSTPSAEAVDLGCSYTLEVHGDGSGLLKVTSGWVAFERDGRESFVPAGAVCQMSPAHGPGTPYLSDASPAFRRALEVLDLEPGAAEARTAALAILLEQSRKEDALTLWHLFARERNAECALVYDRLAALVPPPPGVTRQGVLNRDQHMLDTWWNELGLGEAGWWRQWKGLWPDHK